jgi:hypothetical protein
MLNYVKKYVQTKAILFAKGKPLAPYSRAILQAFRKRWLAFAKVFS